MRKYIATKLHLAQGFDPDEPLLTRCAALPHYVIDRRLTEMLGREDVQKTITAMIQAGVARLPYPQLVVEFDAEHGVRRLVVLTEADGGFAADLVAFTREAMTISAEAARVALTSTGLGISNHRSELDGLAAGFAVAIALMMLNTQGIDKEVVEPTRLNAVRVQSGKPAIPRHTIVRIGTIVDRNGRAVPLNQARHIPIHLRAGHVRHQACGPHYADRKVIYIPPVLVNFKPGDDVTKVRQPKRVLTR